MAVQLGYKYGLNARGERIRIWIKDEVGPMTKTKTREELEAENAHLTKLLLHRAPDLFTHELDCEYVRLEAAGCPGEGVCRCKPKPDPLETENSRLSELLQAALRVINAYGDNEGYTPMAVHHESDLLDGVFGNGSGDLVWDPAKVKE